MKHTQTFSYILMSIILTIGLTSCGGGGGDSAVTSFTVSTSAGAGGSISPASATVNQGSTTSFSVTPDSNYIISSVTGCSGSLSGSTYTTAAITANCTVTASFILAATATLDFDIKIFRFSWADVSGATHYKLMENPDGITGFSQVGSDILPGIQTYDHVVPLYSRINASYILQTCNLAGCVDGTTINISGSLAEAIGYAKASNTEVNDHFGQAVSLSDDGSTLAVGAMLEDSSTIGVGTTPNDDGTADRSGAVYVFIRSGSSWSQQAYIKASNTGFNDQFGYAVSLSGDGNTLAVGANFEDSNETGIINGPGTGTGTDNSAGNSGAVYVFSRSGFNWSQQAYIKASNAGLGDFFGATVSLSTDGDTLAVGAKDEDSTATQSGAAYVFSRSGAIWSEQAFLKASNIGGGDFFGTAVSLSGDGNTLAVSATNEDSNTTGLNSMPNDDGNADDSGAVYVFSRSVTTWSQQAYVKASNTGGLDHFGSAVGLNSDGNTLAVGAKDEDSNTTGLNSTPNDDGSADDSGAVYVFSRSGVSWNQQAYVKASNTDAGDEFGAAVSLSNDGNTLGVGANDESSSVTGLSGDQTDNTAGNAGAVYMLTRSGTSWNQHAYVKASNTEAFDDFGFSVGLSGDGNTLAVGAHFEDSDATGIIDAGSVVDNNNALSSGAVYLY